MVLRGDRNEADGNLNQLLNLRGEDDAQILQWLNKKQQNYACIDVQNELLQTMSITFLREIADEVRF